ncbi:hypothetical protein GUJ93_ZPchr0007g6192 [Zizania palustris]|uniref:Uncharacterized protein n=1 Tax=Zizania palustris TaxID=103762 RepID=A0A8J5T3R7_ZIZPA|nr:hypothetical protein GUJ93_ZPchr0007g6192 [Zizania palustris]
MAEFRATRKAPHLNRGEAGREESRGEFDPVDRSGATSEDACGTERTITVTCRQLAYVMLRPYTHGCTFLRFIPVLRIHTFTAFRR